MRERWEATGRDFVREFPAVLREFFQLQSYMGRPDLFDEQNASQQIFNEQADSWHEQQKMAAWSAARGGQYPRAVSMMREAIKKLDHQGFSSHDTHAIKIFFLRRFGKIYEHWATYGKSSKPHNDPNRQAHFFQAAYLYMLGDIELGGMTEFASRASECFRGAGYHDLGSNFDKAFWGGDMTYVSDADQLDLDILTSRGKKSGSERSGAGKIDMWDVDLPDARYN